MVINPFVFDRPLAPQSGVARTRELEELLRMALGGQSVRLAAPRRYGKTTLLRSLVDVAWEVHDLAPAYVDLSRVTSVDDVVGRVAAGYRRRLKPGVWRAIQARMSAEVQAALPGVGGIRLEVRPTSPVDALAALHEVLELPRVVQERTGRRCLVVFDEFQDLLTVQDDLDGVLRSHLQHHVDVASYVFAGSQPSLMAALFGDRRRPLFDQARSMSLAPLPPAELGDMIAASLEEAGRGELIEHADAVVAVAGGHPQRSMLLAYMLFETGKDAEDPVGDATRAAVREAAEGLEQAWRSATAPQRRVLGAVAEGHERLLTNAALARTGLGKGSQASTRDALVAATHLRVEQNIATFVDPLFPRWIREGADPG